VLTLAVIMALPLVGHYLYLRSGINGVIATAVAAFVCWSGAVAALVLTKRFHGSENAVTGLFLAMFCRTAFPLIAALVLSNTSRSLAEGRVFGAILAFYLLTLAVETALSVGVLNSAEDKAA